MEISIKRGIGRVPPSQPLLFLGVADCPDISMTRNPLRMGSETWHYLGKPEVKVLDSSIEILLLVGFFQFLALLS